jgi:hypothetical protein
MLIDQYLKDISKFPRKSLIRNVKMVDRQWVLEKQFSSITMQCDAKEDSKSSASSSSSS